MLFYALSIVIVVFFPVCGLLWLQRLERRTPTRHSPRQEHCASERVTTIVGDFSALAAGSIEGRGSHVE